MKQLFISAGILLACAAIHAQNEQDVLRYSRTGFGGSARYSSMGGAYGALGGDLSIMSGNPAGLGVYRKSEFSFTPSFFNQKVESTYGDTSSSDQRFNMKVDQFGFVIASKPDNRTDHGWQYMSMAINYSRTNAFQSNALMTGVANSSLMDSWIRSASGTGPSQLDPFNEGLAWNSYMIDPVSWTDTTHYIDRIPDSTQIRQLKSVEIRGGMGEWTFGAAGNYDNRIYVGASVGIPTVNYEEQSIYTEKEVVDSLSNFDYFSFDQYLQTKGRGINFKAGVIFRPYDFLRLGVAFHSPSSLKLSDSYFSKMTSILGDTVRYAESPTGSYRYSIRTPMRVIGSVAFVAMKIAVISFDYELVDYSDGRLKSEDYAYFDENAAVRAKYKSASNLRGGIEFRMLPFSFRAGFAYYGSPYQETVNNEVSRLYITGGAGYRDPKDVYYVDIGFISQRYTENYYFYDQSLVDPVENQWKSLNIMITIGLRFGDEPPKTD